MGFFEDFDREFDQVLDERNRIAKTMAVELHRAIIMETPVDTGDLKKSWTFSVVRPTRFRSETNVEYAPEIDAGRRQVAGRWYGSAQLPKGYEPLIRTHLGILHRRLGAIK